MFVEGNVELAREVAEAFGKAFEALARFHGVSIAAINGYAMGGGLEVALACDIRIAEQQALLGLPEASVGLLPCAGGTQRLTELVGPGWAKRMILCGEKVSASLAYGDGAGGGGGENRSGVGGRAPDGPSGGAPEPAAPCAPAKP